MLYADSISLFATRKFEKVQGLMKIVDIEKNCHIFISSRSSYLPNSMRNLNEIFRKNVSYTNIKSHKMHDFTVSLDNTALEKPQSGSN